MSKSKYNWDRRSDRRKFNDALKRTKIIQYKDQREIFESALNYCYGPSERPIEFREREIKAIMVNSIRHNYSVYERGLKDVHAIKKNNENMYRRYKNVVLNNIAKEYPFLSDACDQQKHYVPMVKKVKAVD